MLKLIRNRRTTDVQRLVLLVSGSWLVPVLLLAVCVLLLGCSDGADETKGTHLPDCQSPKGVCQ